MLSTALVHEIDRLLKEGELSHRKIAARLGVSRGTVSAIAGGRRGLFGKDMQGEGRGTLSQALPAIRCPRCGYRVHPPCLICTAREYRGSQFSRRLQGRNGHSAARHVGALGEGNSPTLPLAAGNAPHAWQAGKPRADDQQQRG